LLAQLPGDFTSLWLVSFIVAVLGVAALWLLVPKTVPAHHAPAELEPVRAARLPPHFGGLVLGATVLAAVTVSDGFVYLLLREKTGTDASLLPLFFVVTATSYMLFSIPVGMLADRFGRARTFLAGYIVLGILYLLLWSTATIGPVIQVGCLLLLGLYYAATEGVLMAAASGALQRHRRATGLAILATGIGCGRLVSSLMFGWLSQMYGASTSVALYAAALPVVVAVCAVWFHARRTIYA
jgi:predicted MFS family arabinose efflux permease